MMKTIFAGLVALLIALAPMSASAQTKSTTWTGCFVGINAGLMGTSSEMTFSWTPKVMPLPDASGKTIGGQVGCDYQPTSQIVVGIVVDGSLGNVAGTSVEKHWFGTETTSLSYQRMLAVSVRAGFVPTPKLLMYGLVGYATAEGTLTSVFKSGSFTDTTTDVGVLTGPLVGVGLEYRVKPHVSFTLEATKYWLASNNSFFDGPAMSASATKVTAGVRWRF